MYYAVIMAGGSGTRLWPLSRRAYPKQALKLVGDKTMFQYAVERITPVFPYQRILVVTIPQHAKILQEQYPEIPAENFILEPEGRGTASAIGLVSIHLLQRDPDACMVILTADHYITKVTHFCNILEVAENIAREGKLVTLGIQPSSPSTGFGYIQQDEIINKLNGFSVYKVKQFIEKPDLVKAQQMLKSGNFSWNSGMFVWKASQIITEFEHQMPKLFAQLMQVKNALLTSEYSIVLNTIWPLITKNTIDYGIMEGAKNTVVIPVDIGWTDIGSWGSLIDLLPADQDHNIFLGSHISIDTKNTLSFGNKRLIATMGVENLVIIDTEDVVMICSKECEQDVKALVEHLKKEDLSQYI
ncbi:MAG: mannose-1-phosphate guanyltransferase [Anaerolinea sp.]|nr:mannose-1-phosphate guanyltransferase [Anaerolinea sp.]